MYMSTCNLKLISMGTLLKNTVTTSLSMLVLATLIFMISVLRKLYYLSTCMVQQTMSPQATHSLASVDYDWLHYHMGHPSKDVLRAAQKHLKDFPDVKIPSQDLICAGYQLEKQPNQSFPHTERRATVPFELTHSDLQFFEVELYHKYKYTILYYDDYTSMAWVICLRSKDQAFMATKQFISYVWTQYNALIKGWRSDAGGEFTSKAFRDYLKNNGIHIHQSAPYAHQQNGRIVETSMSLCLYSTPFTFYPTALLSSLRSKLFWVAKTGLSLYQTMPSAPGLLSCHC